MAIRTYRIGGVVTDTPAEIVNLVQSKTVTAGRYQTLQLSTTLANYQVPSGKTLYLGLLIIQNNTAGALSTVVALGFGTAAVDDSVAAPAGFGSALDAKSGIQMPANTVVQVPYSGVWVIPALNYPCVIVANVNMSFSYSGIVI